MSDLWTPFALPVRTWFRETFAEPTSPQAAAWPAIQAGEHTLILAPTGSGKTLAAFLWGINQIGTHLAPPGPGDELNRPRLPDGVQLLYISPLKALNNDIERNLHAPLTGIRAVAQRMGVPWPEIRVAVRTGDTSTHARALMVKRPPHILITTPESLYLLLSSPRARDILRSVRALIVDEIHTLCGNKRGAHLALSLERLQHLAGHPIQRIGLSATIKPLAEVARFLGGQVETADPAAPADSYTPRPVTVVDTGYRKALDLAVITPVAEFRAMPGDSVWPSVIPQVLQDILRHRSTLIFCNNRRLAERTADRLNAQIEAEMSEEIPPGSSEGLAPGGLMRDRGLFAIGAQGPIRAHHGSMSKEARREMEEALKAGRLPALVGTSSLELGIDIGAVDLVVQLQSPKSVSQALQRVGRAGHLVGQTSKGRIYATFREDIVEAAAVVRGMLDGDVEPTRTPSNPLDVLAQQIVALVALEDWDTAALLALLRRAYPFANLSRHAFEAVLDMLSGGFAQSAGPTVLRARLAWDRVNQRLLALPGARLLAVSNAGTISDRGAFSVYLADGKTRIGELDEEFVFESRPGDAFLLGSQTWRVLSIKDDRIVVGEAAGAMPRMPFWRGDYPWRPYELGLRIGQLRRSVAERLAAGDAQPDAIEHWLRTEFCLDANSARILLDSVRRQLESAGVIASDRTVVVETFSDAIGDQRMVIHTPFGGRINGAWALALSSALADHLRITIEVQANDDGILFRFPAALQAPLPSLVALVRMSADEARRRIVAELPNSAVFGAHFRMNAARAMLLPKALGRKRTPFWLQRLKARDLLAATRQLPDFPIVIETYRECLQDVFDMPHLEELLTAIADGTIEVVAIESVAPSPVAAGLLFNFISVYMYEWDAPKAERQLQALAWRSDLLDDLLQSSEMARLLKPQAIAAVTSQAQHTAPGFQARTVEELAVYLQQVGDLTTGEAADRATGDAAAWLAQLAGQGRIVEIHLPTAHGSELRWIAQELLAEYRAAPARDGDAEETAAAFPGAAAILRRLLRHSGPISRADILARYAFDSAWLDDELARLIAGRDIVQANFSEPDAEANLPAALQLLDRHNLVSMHRRTLTLLRQEVQPVPLAVFSDFLLRWQHVQPSTRLVGAAGLRIVMQQLQGCAAPTVAWTRDILPARVADFDPDDLNALCQSGAWAWVLAGQEARRARARFVPRGDGRLLLAPADDPAASESTAAVYAFLKNEGASFLADIQSGLGLAATAVQGALVELALAGLVTNDTLAALHVLQQFSVPGAAPSAPVSALEAELAARLGPRPVMLGQRPGVGALRRARQQVEQRLRREEDASAWPGRWVIVQRAALLGPPLTDEARAERLTRLVLAREGVILRERLERPEAAGVWALIYPVLQRLELRGEVRRGYFVSGLAGIQYAQPDAVEMLRAAAATPDEALIVISASDPANVWSGETGDEAWRIAQLPSTHLVLSGGRPVLAAEDSGERLRPAADVDPELVRRAIAAYLARPFAPRRLQVNLWDGAPILGSAGQPILQALGFQRLPAGMEWWAGRVS
ncbi:MAG: DEAD/DEAH box helicase [Anaerolineae bacterium]